MKKWLAKENINAIKVSLVACVIFAVLVEPVMQVGKNLGKGIVAALIDYFFYSCSCASGISFISTMVIYATFIFVYLSVRKLVQIAYPSNEKEASAKNPENPKEMATEGQEIGQLVDKLAKTAVRIDKLERKIKKQAYALKITSIVTSFAWIILLFDLAVYQYAPTLMKESFDRRITQIIPYVESQKIDLLKSDWVSMDSKEDYDKIVAEIESILAENNLK